MKYSLEDIFGGWVKVLEKALFSKDFVDLLEYLTQEYDEKTVYPDKMDIFLPFRLVDPKDVKVIILNNYPYTSNYTTGVPLGVEDTSKIPTDLNKIIEALNTTYETGKLSYQGDINDFDYSLRHWFMQGVLVLNVCGTSIRGNVSIHRKKWTNFMQLVLNEISEYDPNILVCAWGPITRKLLKSLDQEFIDTLYCLHPSQSNTCNSSWSCDHFYRINEKLIEMGETEINWINDECVCELTN